MIQFNWCDDNSNTKCCMQVSDEPKKQAFRLIRGSLSRYCVCYHMIVIKYMYFVVFLSSLTELDKKIDGANIAE